MLTKRWTLNADVGEGCDDALVMGYLDCASIACAGHAGNATVMRDTLKLAKQHSVIIGAHPGYPDKANFGRQSIAMSRSELRATVDEQTRLLIALANEQGVAVAYIKPHGALNHDMLANPEVFAAVCQTIATIDKHLLLMLPTNANMAQHIKVAEQYGLSVWQEVFADRAYEPSGLLRARKYPDAVHATPEKIMMQLQRIRENDEIIAIDGSVLNVSSAQTICIHGDHKPSVAAVRALTEQFSKK